VQVAAGCCALRARRSWLVGILWFKGEIGHLERVEVIRRVREVLSWLLSVQLDCRKMAEAKRVPEAYNERHAQKVSYIHVYLTTATRTLNLQSSGSSI
jgi:hypothetical protein